MPLLDHGVGVGGWDVCAALRCEPWAFLVLALYYIGLVFVTFGQKLIEKLLTWNHKSQTCKKWIILFLYGSVKLY